MWNKEGNKVNNIVISMQVTDDYQNQQFNHTVRYKNVKQLYCTLETNIINVRLYSNYTYILEFKEMQKKNIWLFK